MSNVTRGNSQHRFWSNLAITYHEKLKWLSENYFYFLIVTFLSQNEEKIQGSFFRKTVQQQANQVPRRPPLFTICED